VENAAAEAYLLIFSQKNMKNASISSQAIEYILSRQMEELDSLSAASVAQALGIKLLGLSMEFEEKQKIGLDEFILREKIHTAVHVLDRDSQISIDKLARRLGFFESQVFVTAFREYLALEPKHYQQITHLNLN